MDHPAIERAPEPPEASLPSPRELMRATWNLARTDEAIQAGGLVGGAAAGLAVAVGVEGMPIQPGRTERVQAQKGTPPMVEATPLQEVTIGGMTLLGVAAAVAYTRFRRGR